MAIIEERNWFSAYNLNMNLDEFSRLLLWARSAMVNSPGNISPSYLHKTGLWWEAFPPPFFEEKLAVITNINKKKSNPTSIWEFKDGSELLKHTDPITDAGTPIIIPLIGRTKVFTYDEQDENKEIDSFEHGPGMVFILRDGHKKPHRAICLDGYRLIATHFVDPDKDNFRNYTSG